MPEALHKALEQQADKKGLKGERRERYIYGGMRRSGWKPEREKKSSLTFQAKLDLLKHASTILTNNENIGQRSEDYKYDDEEAQKNRTTPGNNTKKPSIYLNDGSLSNEDRDVKS